MKREFWENINKTCEKRNNRLKLLRGLFEKKQRILILYHQCVSVQESKNKNLNLFSQNENPSVCFH